MKTIFAIALPLFLSASFSKTTYAQAEEGRTKIQMTVIYGGKTIVTDLNAVSSSLSRSAEEIPTTEVAKDSVKSNVVPYAPPAYFLTIDAKRLSDDMLKVFAKKQNRFDGTITIIDTYGKYPARSIKFKKASLYNFSDQTSTATYGGEGYGSTAISIGCQEVSINGIIIEQ